MIKRAFDISASALGLVLLSPVLLLIGLAVKLSDGGPAFYRQERVGWHGRPFRIWKFRTMRTGADKSGPSVTRRGDPRITAVGRWLRQTKLDELPQLFNVLAGEMSLVGPRPEVPKYVALYSPEQRRVLELRPGITDLASVEFRNEEELLAAAADAESFYRSVCIPRKIQLNLEYAQRASFGSDLKLIAETFAAIVHARPRDHHCE